MRESEWAKQYGDDNFVIMGFFDTSLFYLVSVFVCSLPCIDKLTVHFTRAFLFCVFSIYFSRRTLVLLALVDHSELLVSCWVALGRLSKAPQRPNTNPACNLPLSSPHCHPGDHMCVLLSSCLQLKQKGMENAKENNSLSPPEDGCRAYYIGLAFS